MLAVLVAVAPRFQQHSRHRTHFDDFQHDAPAPAGNSLPPPHAVCAPPRDRRRRGGTSRTASPASQAGALVDLRTPGSLPTRYASPRSEGEHGRQLRSYSSASTSRNLLREQTRGLEFVGACQLFNSQRDRYWYESLPL